MTTKHSPLRELRRQADEVARVLKACERGEKSDGTFAEKMKAARDKPSFTFVIFMDDKIIKIEMPWPLIKDSSEAGLSEYVLRQMREARDPVH